VNDRLRWPTLISASGLTLNLLVLGNVHGPVRILVTLCFLLACPGMAFVPLLRLPSAATQVVVAVVLSVVLDTLVATAIVEVGGLSTTTGLIAVETVCWAGCVLQLLPWALEPGLRS
jgi:hypothetical protein